MADYLLASGVIFAVLAAWQLVEMVYRRFARRHPELGPFRGAPGCGGGCSCGQGSCTTSVKAVRSTAAPVTSLKIRRAIRALDGE